jgi:hypothetical protein
MAEQPGSLGTTITRAALTTLVTAAVGGIVTWIGGWLPALWAATKAAAAWLWELLTFPVPVPLAILAVLALPWMVIGAAWIGTLFEKKETRSPPAGTPEQPLGELELQLLRLLARADGRYVGFENAADHLHASRLLLERACDELLRRDLIEPHRDVLHGPQIGLTREGREFVIKAGFPLGRERSW